jgi:NADPH-dependent 2,4-dienoyl-CoA reductase/sulfur reductase-like enzyme/rhodanese-related sulfurtransferase
VDEVRKIGGAMSVMSNPNDGGLRVVIVGGVAGGMSAATRLRRLDESAIITVIERSGYVSYANCGLPYFVGGVIQDEDDLLLQTPSALFDRFRLDVRVATEVVGIDRERHIVLVRSTSDGSTSELPYDRIVLSPGALAIRPPITGFDRVRSLKTIEDAQRLSEDVAAGPRSAVVIGAGFIGLETAENLLRSGIDVTVVEAADQILTPLDAEMAVLIAAELVHRGVHVITGAAVTEVTNDAVILADGRSVPAELVVGSIGVRPDARLAVMASLELGSTGAIRVNHAGQTSDPEIYAVGDAVEKSDWIDGGASLVALANVANRQGRRAADHIAGRGVREAPSLGTAIVKVFARVAAMTGWNEKRLLRAGRDYRVVRSHPMNHAGYYPGAQQMSIKVLFDPVTEEILGAQIVGGSGVDKRIDVLATAITGGIRVTELADLELAYAPPFSSAKDPVNMLGYMAENAIVDGRLVEPEELPDLLERGWQLVDVRTDVERAAGSIPGSRHIPVDEIRRRSSELGEAPIVVYCAVGQRGHTAAALLRELGLSARNLDGGYRTWLAADAARRGDPIGLLTSTS